MCRGVTRGFAGEKFSGSPKRFGKNRAKDRRHINISRAPKRSLYE